MAMAVVILLALLLAVPLSSAGQVVWTGGAGAWNTPQQWRPARVPAFPDDVLVDSVGADVALPAAENASARALLLDATSAWISFPSGVRRAYVWFGDSVQPTTTTTAMPGQPPQQRDWVGGSGNWTHANLWQPPVVPCGNDVAVLSPSNTPSNVQLFTNVSVSALLAHARGSWLSFMPGTRHLYVFLTAADTPSCRGAGSTTSSPATASSSTSPAATASSSAASATTTSSTAPSVVTMPPGSTQEEDGGSGSLPVALIAGAGGGFVLLVILIVVLVMRRKRQRERTVVALPRVSAGHQATAAVYENPTFDSSGRYEQPDTYQGAEATYEAADMIPGAVDSTYLSPSSSTDPRTKAPILNPVYASSEPTSRAPMPGHATSTYDNATGPRATRFWDPSMYNTDDDVYDSVT